MVFFFTGHCLGITDYGNLNEDVCDKFVSGCPSNEYNSTDIYKCAYLFLFFLMYFLNLNHSFGNRWKKACMWIEKKNDF